MYALKSQGRAETEIHTVENRKGIDCSTEIHESCPYRTNEITCIH